MIGFPESNGLQPEAASQAGGGGPSEPTARLQALKPGASAASRSCMGTVWNTVALVDTLLHMLATCILCCMVWSLTSACVDLGATRDLEKALCFLMKRKCGAHLVNRCNGMRAEIILQHHLRCAKQGHHTKQEV